ncbi:hypothetical protein KKG29_00085 [Patescibacteria group bacterium]|nr:hypothetical protein [Patescibacteria group bacterium]MBU3999568.1 hypothetical protein [Patescibacteria group bacterium]MBU4056575.1 hypothetical protein [Patescibacteria group bacterium]MBU4368385.1 hypothetical protein [Patescibacteria group bacterium]
MQKQTKPELLGAPTAKMILAVAIIVSLGALFGALGYLAKNKQIVNQEPGVSIVPNQITSSFEGTLISG